MLLPFVKAASHASKQLHGDQHGRRSLSSTCSIASTCTAASMLNGKEVCKNTKVPKWANIQSFWLDIGAAGSNCFQTNVEQSDYRSVYKLTSSFRWFTAVCSAAIVLPYGVVRPFWCIAPTGQALRSSLTHTNDIAFSFFI
jgi:hypothetical protein